MDLPAPISQKLYDKTIKTINSAIKIEAEDSMLSATAEEIREEGSKDVKSSGDGTWQKRGFSSKNGAVTLVGAKTGKVLDVEVMTTVCFGCTNYKGSKSGPEFQEWQEDHAPQCTVNHTGSSGMMEVNGMVRIFERSEQRGGVRYAQYIGDGDSKTYPAIVKAKPYKDDLVPQKVSITYFKYIYCRCIIIVLQINFPIFSD